MEWEAEKRRLKALVSEAFCHRVTGGSLDDEWMAKAQVLGCGWVADSVPPETLEQAQRWAKAWGVDLPALTSGDVSAALAESLALDGMERSFPASELEGAKVVIQGDVREASKRLREHVVFEHRGKRLVPESDHIARARAVLLDIAEGKEPHTAPAVRVAAAKALLGLS